MKKQTLILAGVLAGSALLAGGRVLRAGNDDPTQLRSQGPVGLDKFWNAHRSEIEAHSAKLRAANFSMDAGWRLLSEQLDAVAGQRDAWSSHLYWFTDLEAAKAAAKAQHKPILSLRMLGRLTDEYSCANSRFFRTALYANTEISQTLRDKFILFWSSERPVPVVTIDMGNGRVVKRTLTGNSAHYLLDADGRPLDVLPGLYGPGAFQSWLERGEALFRDCDALEGPERSDKLKAWHDAELVALTDNYIAETKASNAAYWGKADQKIADQYRESTLKGLRNTSLLDAKAAASVAAPIAGRVAATKSVRLEAPVLNATALYSMSTPFSREQIAYWSGISPYLAKCRLDENSRLLMRSQRPVLDDAPISADSASQIRFTGFPIRGQISQSVEPPAEPFARLVDRFERSIAIDTQRNEWNFHAPLHQWFITHEVNNFDDLNRIIYDKLFLTPQSDPWLGLSPAGTYTGLSDGGLFEASNAVRQASTK